MLMLVPQLIGGPGTLFSGSGQTTGQGAAQGNGAGENSDNMSINGSIVSGGSVGSGGGAGGGAATQQTNQSLSNGHINGVHSNGLATLPLVRPNTGDTSRTATLDSPKHDNTNGQNGKLSGKAKLLRLRHSALCN